MPISFKTACILGACLFLYGGMTTAAEWHISESDNLVDCFTQGWSKPQRNKSVEGKTLSVGGVTFKDGIGSHAPSQCYIMLDGKADRITGLVGVDGEVKDKGSVFFWIVDAQKNKVLWKSSLRKGGEKALPFDVPLKDVRQLQLRITDSGDGNNDDHANWLNIVVSYSGEEPILSEAVFTSDADNVWKLNREPMNLITQRYGSAQRDRAFDNRPLSVGGIRYREGVGTHASSTAYIQLDGSAGQITGLAGVDDEVGDKGSVVFQIINAENNAVLWDSRLKKGGESASHFSVPLKGVTLLLLNVIDSGDGTNNDHADWIDVKITYEGQEPKLVNQ